MSITEEKLKAYILSKYRSIRDFANSSNSGLPYTTIDGMLKRGIQNTSISNVLKLCGALNISADELAKGNIVPISNNDPIQTYALKLSQLTPENFNTVIKYIDFLLSTQPD